MRQDNGDVLHNAHNLRDFRKRTFPVPPNGILQCCECGAQIDFPDDVPYEDLAACPDDNCNGQMFCNNWSGWSDVLGSTNHEYKT